MTTTAETITIHNSYKDSCVVIDIETAASKTVSAQIRNLMITQTLLKNTILFLKRAGMSNPGEAADLLHSATIAIWDTVNHEHND